MKTDENKESNRVLKDRILLCAGRLFCQNNAFTSSKDKRITFEVNAEDCYQHFLMWKRVKLVLFVMTLLAGIATIDSHPNSVVFVIAAVVIMFGVIFNAIPGFLKNERVVEMAKLWAPQRKKLLSLIKIAAWKDVDFKSACHSACHPEEYKEKLGELFKKIALCIAIDSIKVESLTCASDHKKQDKQKEKLNELVASLNSSSVPWEELFDTAIRAHGKRETL